MQVKRQLYLCFLNYTSILGILQWSPNMFGDPLFVDFDNFDYNLSQNSPAIDAGNPNMLDPDGTRSDIGAYYYHQEASVPENRIPNIVNGFELISVYPNPFNSEFNLTFKNEFPLNVGISMFDLNGRLVKDYGAKWFASGEHKVQFAQQNLPAGQYVLQVKTEYGQFEIQVINIK